MILLIAYLTITTLLLPIKQQLKSEATVLQMHTTSILKISQLTVLLPARIPVLLLGLTRIQWAKIDLMWLLTV